MKLLVLLGHLVVCVLCRPQGGGNVEVEKQDIIQLNTESSKNETLQKAVEENTKEILRKIDEVNKKHGLHQKPFKINYFHFPHSFSRSNSDNSRSFKFPRSPFENPILDFIENGELSNENNNINTKLRQTEIEDEDVKKDEDGHSEEDHIIQPIKRKVVHQQTVLLPNMMGVTYNGQPVYENNLLPYLPSHNLIMGKPIQENVADYKKTSAFDMKTQNNLDKKASHADNFNYLRDNYVSNINRPNRQNWNWPGAQYFPIIIRDPFLQMYNAITTLIEYGPNVMGGGGGCKKSSHEATKKGKSLDFFTNIQFNDSGVHVIGDKFQNAERLTKHFKMKEENSGSGTNELSVKGLFNLHQNPLSTTKRPLQYNSPESPPKNQPVLGEDELDEEKAEIVNVSNDAEKKLFSKDNTGSGIFIHKLKVRRGGVAIAGPGGIATAGSGGTAIVGPNGYAYTQPDSLAIAGSGSKVISVDPNVNLSDIVKHFPGKNREELSTRLGKIVAEGPVIYYNRG